MPQDSSATAGAPSAPNGAAEMELGQRLRSAREQRGMTIGQVADFTGLSRGFISQVERDKVSASVASLMAICNALNLQIASLFEPPRTHLVRRHELAPIRMTGHGVQDYLLSPRTHDSFQVIETVVEPSGGGDPMPYRLPAEGELVLVLEGGLRVQVDVKVFELHAGDALTFSARVPHTWRNLSDEEPARVLWVLTRASGI